MGLICMRTRRDSNVEGRRTGRGKDEHGMLMNVLPSGIENHLSIEVCLLRTRISSVVNFDEVRRYLDATKLTGCVAQFLVR